MIVFLQNIYLRDRPLPQLLDQLLSVIVQMLPAQERRAMSPCIIAIRKDPDVGALCWKE